MNQKPLHSRDEVRDFLKRPDLSDNEVEELQETMYAMAQTMVDDYIEKHFKKSLEDANVDHDP